MAPHHSWMKVVVVGSLALTWRSCSALSQKYTSSPWSCTDGPTSLMSSGMRTQPTHAPPVDAALLLMDALAPVTGDDALVVLLLFVGLPLLLDAAALEEVV